MKIETQVEERTPVGIMKPTVEEYIDKSEVGKRLRMRPRTIDDWMKRGLLPYYKMGRAVRFKWSEVELHLGRTCRVSAGGREAVIQIAVSAAPDRKGKAA